MQAIVTSYANDDSQRAAIVAACRGKSVTVPYDSSLGLDDNHVNAALRLARILGWRYDWNFGRLATGDYVHVALRDDRAYSTIPAPSETSPPESWRGRGAGSVPSASRRGTAVKAYGT